MNKVLILDDDPDILELIELSLKKVGFDVIPAENSKKAQRIFQSDNFLLLIVDRTLPCIDGLDFVKNIRKSGNTVPVIFLTARSELEERLDGFKNGGDDYITKPFDIKEFVARVQALLRRCQTTTGINSKIISYRDIKLDPDSYSVSIALKPINLTKLEFKLLKEFMEKPNVVLNRNYLLENVWDCIFFDENCNDKTVNIAIKRLRSKIDPDGSKKYIQSVRGIGYKLI
jgi:DNA-binding response OmpR family regulator